MNFIQQLLAGVAGQNPSTPSPVPAQAPDLGEEILVQGSATPRRTIPEDMRGEPGIKVMEELIPRKGMFGLKGTLRDVLGAVGDAFLVQSGNKPQYAPYREREKAASALYGFTEDPMAAIERLSVLDPDAALAVYDKTKEYEYRNAQVEAQRLKAQADAGKAGDDRYQQYGRLFSQYAGAASPETYSRVAPLLKVLKERGGLGDEYQVPDQYDEGLLTSYRDGGMPAQAQVSTDLRREGMAQQREIAVMNERGRQARFQPRAAPQPRPAPNPTSASIAAPILQKIQSGGTPTRGEQEVLKRLGYSQDRGTTKKRQPPPLPPGFKLK